MSDPEIPPTWLTKEPGAKGEFFIDVVTAYKAGVTSIQISKAGGSETRFWESSPREIEKDEGSSSFEEE